MTLWFVSMECANIAEAGGVKNVTFSLCKEFALLGHKVSLFIPVFKCNSWDKLSDVQKDCIKTQIDICNKKDSNTKILSITGNIISWYLTIVFSLFPSRT